MRTGFVLLAFVCFERAPALDAQCSAVQCGDLLGVLDDALEIGVLTIAQRRTLGTMLAASLTPLYSPMPRICDAALPNPAPPLETLARGAMNLLARLKNKVESIPSADSELREPDQLNIRDPYLPLSLMLKVAGLTTVLLTMGMLFVVGYRSVGAKSVFFLGVTYAAVFLAAGANMWHSETPSTKWPGGLLVTTSVCLVPLTVHGLQEIVTAAIPCVLNFYFV